MPTAPLIVTKEQRHEGKLSRMPTKWQPTRRRQGGAALSIKMELGIRIRF